MTKPSSFLFLGTGGSMGIPIIGCHCAVCRSHDPRNARFRSSGLLRTQGKQLLIDAGPELRLQVLRSGIEHLDGVLLTHAHFDHIAGIDDLRAFFFLQKTRLPCLLSLETFEEIKTRYHYLLKEAEEGSSLSAQLQFEIIEEDFKQKLFCGVPLSCVSYEQAKVKVSGFRFDSFAYISDIRTYSKELIDSLRGIKTLVLSALRPVATKMHFGLPEAVQFMEEVGAERTFLTHISHELDHVETERSLPPGMQLGYDGLEIFL